MIGQSQQQSPYFGANPGYVYQGYGYGQAPVQQKINNVLTAEEIKELQQERSQFSLGITAREAKQAACNHRTADGTSDSLVFDQESGKARCTICGYEFRPIDADTSYESISDAADRIVDILQTIKMMYTDLPGSAAREYFQIIPMIGKIPQLFEFAAKNFAKHEYDGWGMQNYGMSGVTLLNNLSNMFGAPQQPGYGYGAPQQQPGFGYGAPQQPYGYAPQGAPMTPPQGQPAPTGNPFGYPGASEVQQQGYQPQSAGFAYNPTAAAPGAVPPSAPQPTAPVAPAETAQPETVTQKVTV